MIAEIETKVKKDLKKPSKYKVYILNDDYTPMDFVVFILMNLFNKKEHEAIELMLKVHHDGKGLVGIYPKEIAETKVFEANETAKKYNHPLKTIMQKD